MQLPRLERRPELDALRGLFLVWMTLTHLPTRFSDFVNSPIGFVSSAEGFVFISALLVGRLYIRELVRDSSVVRARLWKRSLQIYAYHLIILALVFTVAAAFAVHTHKAAINHLLDFYLAHPFVAIIGSVLLLYCPPLLDILPMYVTFLFFTPMLLSMAVRFGWKKILLASGCIWLLAQFGLRDVVHNWVVHVTHLNIPLQETGAFNLFAWQAIWAVGCWIGARSAMREQTFEDPPGWLAAIACFLCLCFIGIRWGWLGPHLTQQALGIELDKWQIGPLRVINLITFSIVVYWLRRHLVRVVAIEPFLTLGKASLRVFCTHLFFVFVGLALLVRDVNDDVGAPLEQLHGITAVLLITVTFIVLILVAARQVQKRREERLAREGKKTSAGPAPVRENSHFETRSCVGVAAAEPIRCAEELRLQAPVTENLP
ncbi:MAG TPA: OpgC domain-containing protein [Terracidiphilus sp.]|nr:OpgC domain-containing protein [Terracidiphilus sp.]